MNKKTKMVMGLVGLAAFIGLAFFAYTKLSSNFTPKSDISNTESSSSEAVIAPDFTAYDKDGNKVTLSEHIGKPIVLNFWATWCGYCKEEMPYFNDIYNENKDDVVFLMVDVVDGVRETQEAGQKYIDENGFNFPVLFDLDQDASNNYGIRSFPTTVIINKDGTVFGIQQGMLSEESLRTAVKNILK